MDIQKIIDTLHPLERKVFPLLLKYYSLKEIINVSGMQEVEVMRAVQWLNNKKLIFINETYEELIFLGENGKKYLETSLPERLFLNAISEKSLTLDEIGAKTKLTREELEVSLGILRRKNAIEIHKIQTGISVSITSFGKKSLEKESFEEKFLKRDFPIPVARLTEEDRLLLDELKKRKDIINLETIKVKSLSLSEIGKEVMKHGIETDVIEKLTTQLIASKEWKGKTFRRYDITSQVPAIHPGRMQHYRRFLDEIKQKFLELGFSEMSGSMVETDFWNMDALFMPQFHSARDIHQAYYVKEPKYAKELPEQIVKNVKMAHENGFGTGSRGWRYDFDIQRTHRYLLRTQGTACSARTLASPELKIPGKYFAIARCFRPDIIDSSHHTEFNQLEGIVIDKTVNFKNLLGMLKTFAERITGSKKIKFLPAYFPFTEPSVEGYIWHEKLKKWLEVLPAGIFRPELTLPLGIKEKVLAWGIGIDRLYMIRENINDIRQLFSQNLEYLRG